MGGKLKYIACVLLLFFFSKHFSTAQELSQNQQQYLETLIESVGEGLEDSPDLTSLFNELSAYLADPLNLNSAKAKDLAQLYFLNDYQIAAILDYRNRNGPIQSIYELQYLPGFRDEDIEFLLVFTKCGELSKEDVPVKKSLKYADHLLIMRYQRVLEKQAGFVVSSDSVLELNPDKSRRLGSPDKYYFRYGFQAGRQIRAGILAEKDPGEEFFRGSNSKGFDFYSAYVSYEKEETLIRKVLVGDYQIQFGQGLLLWSSYAFGKSAYTNDLARRPGGIKGNVSVDENRFLRGGAIELGYKRISFTAFASSRSRDATLTDSTTEIVSLRETGYHSTPTEIAAEGNISQTTIGGSIRYTGTNLHAGINTYATNFNYGFEQSDQLYRAFLPNGKHFSGLSADYRYMTGQFQIFGEWGYAYQGMASVNGLLYFLKPGMNLGLIYRNYSQNYYSFYSNAFAEGSSVSNESGFYFGADLNFSNYYVRAYADIFTFPWLKYQVDAPSNGTEFLIESGTNMKKTQIYLRFKHEEKQANSEAEDFQNRIGYYSSDQIRANIVFNSIGRVSFQSRIDIKKFGEKDATKTIGYLVFQDIKYLTSNSKVSLSTRLAYFNTKDYATRIYAYERDVLYAYTNQMYYGEGFRFMFLGSWKPVDRITFYLRFAQSLYPGKDSVGSGLSLINTNHKSEIKAQMVFRF